MATDVQEPKLVEQNPVIGGAELCNIRRSRPIRIYSSPEGRRGAGWIFLKCNEAESAQIVLVESIFPINTTMDRRSIVVE